MRAMSAPLFECLQLSKHYDGKPVVQDLSFQIAPGECLGLIGPNGAGKTTTLRMCLGLSRPDQGQVRAFGLSMPQDDLAIKSRLGVVSQFDSLDPDFTCAENLLVFGRYFGLPDREIRARIPALLEFAALTHKADARPGELSGGMKRRLSLARALIHQPDVLLLDEPTTGLDPGAIRDFYRILRELKGEGVTMVLTSHILAEIQERVDRLAVMEGGLIRATGTVQALREAMNLPLTLEIAGGAGLREQVTRLLDGMKIDSIDEAGSVLHIRLPREAKMPALARLATLGDTMRDLHVREPSLEDVFFGYRKDA